MLHTARQAARVISLLLCLLLSACGQTLNTDESPAQRVPGVTASEIRLGSSLALTGHAGYLGTQTLRGAMSYIKHINDSGGIHGRMITVDARDDGYDPPRCLANTQCFLIEDTVFALFSYVGTPTTVRILPLVEEAKIPLLGMFTGANALRSPFHPYVINVRASYYQETGEAVRHLVNDLKLTRIAVFYQYDAYGFDGLTGAELALRELGLAPVARGSYIRGTTDVVDGLNRILPAAPEAVIMVGTYEPSAAFIRKAEKAGLHAVFYNLSFAGSEQLAQLLGNGIKNPVIMSQVVPPPTAPEANDLLGVTADYVRHLKHYYPSEVPNTVGLEGYVNARVLVEALRRAGRSVTREKFLDAIQSMQAFSLGGQTSVSFSATDHQGMDQVYFTKLVKGKGQHPAQFKLINNFSEIRDIVPNHEGLSQ